MTTGYGNFEDLLDLSLTLDGEHVIATGYSVYLGIWPFSSLCTVGYSTSILRGYMASYVHRIRADTVIEGLKDYALHVRVGFSLP